LQLEAEAKAVEAAVAAVLEEGHRTADLAALGAAAVTTQEMGNLAVEALAAGKGWQ
jgi:3-isopropylmalate dehydrogenase